MEKCSDCQEQATIYHPAPFCDTHWADRFSTQNVDGEPIHGMIFVRNQQRQA